MSDLPLARILIADDEPLYLRTTAELLRKSGYDCTCAMDGGAALQALASGTFDLILSDLNMPGNLKLELLQEGRQSRERLRVRHHYALAASDEPRIPEAHEPEHHGAAVVLE